MRDDQDDWRSMPLSCSGDFLRELMKVVAVLEELVKKRLRSDGMFKRA